MLKPTCNICESNFKVLTQEGLCAYCFKNENKFWSQDFSDYTKDKNGNLTPNKGPMKFNKTKQRNKKKKKKKGK